MTTKKESTQTEDPGTLSFQEMESVLAQYVLSALGRPLSLFKVSVHHLWGHHYRVNVLTGEDSVSAVVAHSYFLVTDSNGVVIGCNPRITRSREPSPRAPADGPTS